MDITIEINNLGEENQNKYIHEKNPDHLSKKRINWILIPLTFIITNLRGILKF
jgi:hypothetical protein